MQIWLNQGLVRRIFRFSVSKRNNHYGTTNDNVKYIPEMNQKKENTFSIPRSK